MQSRGESVLVTAVLLVAVATIAAAAGDPESGMDPYSECLLEKLRTANDETPVSEIREACPQALGGSRADESEEATPLEARIEETKATEEMRFVITPFKPNYVLVGLSFTDYF